MALSLIYLQVSLFVWLCVCVLSSPHQSVSLSWISLFPSFCYFLSPLRTARPSYLLLTARMQPLCPILYSDVPWWSSIRTSFNLLGGNWGCDCMWLCCFGYDTHQSKAQDVSRCYHPRGLSLISAPFPHAPSSINLSPSHQVRAVCSAASNTDSRYLSSGLSLITALCGARGELSRVPLLYST